MRCSEAQQIIYDSLEGQLEPELQQQLEAHLAECEKCALLWEECRRTLESISAAAVPAPDFIQSGIKRCREEAKTMPVKKRRRFQKRMAAYGATAAAVVVLIGAYFLCASHFSTTTPGAYSSGVANATAQIAPEAAAEPSSEALEPRASASALFIDASQKQDKAMEAPTAEGASLPEEQPDEQALYLSKSALDSFCDAWLSATQGTSAAQDLQEIEDGYLLLVGENSQLAQTLLEEAGYNIETEEGMKIMLLYDKHANGAG